jgi:HPt (histidine-containing phosphotransfer) domain-containing protein
MQSGHTDLTVLTQLFKGDRTMIREWITTYLEEGPEQFKALAACLANSDTKGLAAVAHDLRPTAHYLGAARMLELSKALGEQARTAGAGSCKELVEELVALGAAVHAELRTAMERDPELVELRGAGPDGPRNFAP